MKTVVNRRTKCNYALPEKKDFRRGRRSFERFHLKATPLVIEVAKFLKKYDEGKHIAFLHYIMNQLGKDYDGEIEFYQRAIERIRTQKLINLIYYQHLYDFPSLSEPRNLEHLRKLRRM